MAETADRAILDNSEAKVWSSPLWYLSATLVLILGPSQFWLGVPLWLLPPNEMPAGLGMGISYLTLALFLRLRTAHRAPIGAAILAILASLACFGAVSAFLLAHPHIVTSRRVLLSSAALGTFLALVPIVFAGRHRIGVASLASLWIVLLALGIGGTVRQDARARPNDRVIVTALAAVSVTHVSGVAGPQEPGPGAISQATGGLLFVGGAIARYGEGFLLVTGRGEIFRLNWGAVRNTLSATRLALSAPMDHAAFLADQKVPWRTLRYRVTDVALDTAATPARIYLAHQHWDRDAKCLRMRVSAAPLPAGSSGHSARSSEWVTAFESQPCLKVSGSFDGTDNGGRLAWTGDGHLLLTLGDHGLNGRIGPPAVAQSTDSDYGKVVMLDLKGGRTIFSSGHRNPQGLFVDRKGRIWETEHGPQGGDELNLLHRGGNYGWPFETYGTDYGRMRWSIRKPDDGNRYEEPVQAFTPGIAISNLIEVGPQAFPEWDGDLLIGSLRAQSIYRVRLNGDHVAYVEPIPLGRRIRDLEQGKDGRIVIWTDEGDLVVLAPALRGSAGEVLFDRCRRCHESAGGAATLGPDLHGIVGRRVASEGSYRYSAALVRTGGSWTEKNLDAFLQDPAEDVPGTSMEFEGVREASERRALIEFLKYYR